VHRILGRGFLEAVYQEALGVEFAKRNIPHVTQQTLMIEYKGTVLHSVYVADFVCYDQVIVELNALDQLTSTEESQL
jgi:GxxExxY protein